MKRFVSPNELRILDDQERMICGMTEKCDGGEMCTVALKGALTHECAYDLEDELLALISVGKGITFDMAETESISGTFAKLLVSVQARLDETSFEAKPIQNMPKEICESLRKIGCLSSLEYELKEE